MKRFLKVKNKIYRRYLGDLWGEVILKGKITRIFKFILQVYTVSLKKLYYRKTKLIKIRKKAMFVKKLKTDAYFFKAFLRKRYSSIKNSNKYVANINKWRLMFWLNFKHLYHTNINVKRSKKIILPSYLKLIRRNFRNKFHKQKQLFDALKRVTRDLG